MPTRNPVSVTSPIVASLANAIALANGYNVVGSIPNKNNNPGNLKNGDAGSGVDSAGNTIYKTPEMGNVALRNYAAHILNGNNKTFSYDPSKTPLSAIGAVIAPNDATWIKNVASSLGVNPSVKLGAIASGSTPVTPSLQILPVNKLTLQGTLPGQDAPPTSTPSAPAGASAGNQVGVGFPVVAAVPVAGQPISGTDTTAATAATLNLQISDASMSAIPWYSDNNLITGNQRIRNSMGNLANGTLTLPVSFQVYLSKSSNSLLINPVTQKPITVQLNASMTEFSLLSKHIFNRQPTRTGMHITFWGMAADLITGSASTGVFMNQYGITDYFSTTKITDDIASMVGRSFSNDPDVEMAIAANPEAYRVAAQDAFVEFLKLFQMNGNVWYSSTANNDPTQLGQNQVAPSVWQANSGATNFQQNSRNNDVRSKGYVVMTYKNSRYLGYFKSLSWAMDADKPFQWTFNFTFQVEKTLTALYCPIPAAPTLMNIPINTRQIPSLGPPDVIPPPTGS